MSAKIKTGDVVMLKSGGPAMTVGDVGPREGAEEDMTEVECICAWFEVLRCGSYRVDALGHGEARYGTAQRGMFHVDMLKIVEVAS